MKPSELTASAKNVFCASTKSIDEYKEKSEQLLTSVNEKMLKRPDILELINGEQNVSMMKDNHANHIRFIASILATPDAESLVEVISWVFRAYKSRGFHSNYWVAQINTWLEVLKDHLTPEAYNEIKPIYEWISNNIPFFDNFCQQAAH